MPIILDFVRNLLTLFQQQHDRQADRSRRSNSPVQQVSNQQWRDRRLQALRVVGRVRRPTVHVRIQGTSSSCQKLYLTCRHVLPDCFVIFSFIENRPARQIHRRPVAKWRHFWFRPAVLTSWWRDAGCCASSETSMKRKDRVLDDVSNMQNSFRSWSLNCWMPFWKVADISPSVSLRICKKCAARTSRLSLSSTWPPNSRLPDTPHFQRRTFLVQVSHYHCTREGCNYRFTGRTHMFKHQQHHERVAGLVRDDFKRFKTTQQCDVEGCPYTGTSTHFHCLRCSFKWVCRAFAMFVVNARLCLLLWHCRFSHLIKKNCNASMPRSLQILRLHGQFCVVLLPYMDNEWSGSERDLLSAHWSRSRGTRLAPSTASIQCLSPDKIWRYSNCECV